MHSVALHTRVSEPTTKICMKIDHILSARGGATPGPGRSYALPLKNLDLALGPACEILIKYTVKA